MHIIHETSTRREKEAFFRANPSKLYKYRDWNDDYHKKVITDSELFFSSPGRFNDPYDCSLPFKQDPNNNDPVVIMQKVEETAPKQFPHLVQDKQALQEQCAKQVLKIMQDPESWFEMNWGFRPKELHRDFGVLSLTPHPDNYLMWSHYANSHTGFCVEFDTRTLVESIAGHYQKITYSDTIPFFSILDRMEDELITKLLYTKSTIWGYEDEYRISRIHKSDTPIKFNRKALTAVYFGCHTSYEQQMEITEIAKKLYPNVVFRRFDLGKQKFELIEGQLKLF